MTDSVDSLFNDDKVTVMTLEDFIKNLISRISRTCSSFQFLQLGILICNTRPMSYNISTSLSMRLILQEHQSNEQYKLPYLHR